MKSRTIKVSFLWLMFVLALIGTYLLSHKINSGTYDSIANTAATFFSTGYSREIGLYMDHAEPLSVTVGKGDEVLFVVKDKSKHDIAEERTEDRRGVRLESGEIGKDESYSLVFEKSGTFYFYDRVNQGIHITVIVK